VTPFPTHDDRHDGIFLESWFDALMRSLGWHGRVDEHGLEHGLVVRCPSSLIFLLLASPVKYPHPDLRFAHQRGHAFAPGPTGWKELPEPIRAAIVALVGTARK
jgi:hypothetical protein